MNKLQQWIYAYKVCKKYSLKLKWTPHKDFGQYNWEKKTVRLDWFSKHFMSILLHEVGHHVEDRKVMGGYGNYLLAPWGGPNKDGVCIYKQLKAEAFASRFAVKTGKANKKFLIKCFNTYSADLLRKPYLLCKFGIYERVINTIEYCTRRIEND